MSASFNRFEDIPVWRAGRELVKAVYAVSERLRDWGFRDQFQRAAISVTNNIAEGHERGTTPDLLQFLYYAKGSAGEVRSMLWNAEDLGYLSAEDAAALRNQAEDIGRQLFLWTTSMQAQGFAPGPKYHGRRNAHGS